MIGRVLDWWRHYRVKATDLEIAGAYDKAYVMAWSGRWFKPYIEIECSRDDLLLLGEMIRDYAADEWPREGTEHG